MDEKKRRYEVIRIPGDRNLSVRVMLIQEGQYTALEHMISAVLTEETKKSRYICFNGIITEEGALHIDGNVHVRTAAPTSLIRRIIRSLMTATAICADRIDRHLESLMDAGGNEYGL